MGKGGRGKAGFPQGRGYGGYAAWHLAAIAAGLAAPKPPAAGGHAHWGGGGTSHYAIADVPGNKRKKPEEELADDVAAKEEEERGYGHEEPQVDHQVAVELVQYVAEPERRGREG